MSREIRQQKKPSIHEGSPEWNALRGASKMAILDILIETMRRCEGHADDACDLAEIAYIANPVLEARGDAQIQTGRLLRAAEDDAVLRAATHDECLASDASLASAGIISALVRGERIDCYVDAQIGAAQ